MEFLGGGLAAVVSFYGLMRSSADTSVGGAYVAFTCALIIWGWLEMSFLMGVVTGRRRLPCPAAATGVRRFRYAVDAILYHELAIVVTGALVFAITAGSGNQVGALTFLILWAMRLSAKLNIFFGVRNLTEEFLPEQISYLKTYFKKEADEPVFPFLRDGIDAHRGLAGAARDGAWRIGFRQGRRCYARYVNDSRDY